MTNRRGLYDTGGTGRAIRLVRVLFQLCGLSNQVQKLCSATTLNEQREIWRTKIRRLILNRFLNWTLVGTEAFAWKAAGVPATQLKMIQRDYLDQDNASDGDMKRCDIGGAAMWEYLVNTLDPIAANTLLSRDNYFYLLCLQGHYTRSYTNPFSPDSNPTANSSQQQLPPGLSDATNAHQTLAPPRLRRPAYPHGLGQRRSVAPGSLNPHHRRPDGFAGLVRSHRTPSSDANKRA